MSARIRLTFALVCIGLVVGLLFWLGRGPASAAGQVAASRPHAPATRPDARALRLGILPERDIFAQRRRFKALGEYLSKKLDRPVELVTVISYRDILEDMERGDVDVAVLGSLVAVMAVDRLDASIIGKAELADGTTTYAGTVFVLDGSPIQKIEDLGGKSLAMVRTTTAGHLYPMGLIVKAKLLDADKPPRPVYVGTHDDSILAVVEKRVDAGAVKLSRLEEYERANPQTKLRRLATSETVPDSAVVVRKDLAASLGPRLRDILLAMPDDEQGRKALAEFGARRFRPCELREYKALCEMVCTVRPVWNRIGIDGQAPRELGCDHPATKPGK